MSSSGMDGDDRLTDEQIRGLYRARHRYSAEYQLDIIRAFQALAGTPTHRAQAYVRAYLAPARARCRQLIESSSSVTAETITDAQIRELRGTACDGGTEDDVLLWRACDVALGGEDRDLGMIKDDARDRCAAAWNARHAAAPDTAITPKPVTPKPVKPCVGARVRWASQSAGVKTTKTGTIMHVVAPGESVRDASGLREAGRPRQVESYLVRGDNGRLYWPRVSALEVLP